MKNNKDVIENFYKAKMNSELSDKKDVVYGDPTEIKADEVDLVYHYQKQEHCSEIYDKLALLTKKTKIFTYVSYYQVGGLEIKVYGEKHQHNKISQKNIRFRQLPSAV